MKMQQKFAVYFLAALIFMIGAGLPVVSALEVAPIQKEISTITYIESEPAAPLILIQQKPATLVSAGWETSLKIPGFELCDLNYSNPNPELTAVGQIFVVDLESYHPCKSQLLFPFHDFI